MTELPRLWHEFVEANPQFADEVPEVEPFGDTPEMADDLARLVLAGTKRATASPVEEGVAPEDAHWVLLDGRGEAVAVLHTHEIRMGRLDSVDDAFAWDEGEGDRTRDWWLDAHRGFFRRRLPHVTDFDALPTVFERFTVVWPPALAD
ncbi:MULTISPECIES: ASCH domain-containing protein [unclassified Aeromicrobium]|uniref:ASCH domain-containing protein n=1 Tax=unclassified Aeromicrobium TaxID=2633570 RepID=UPI00396B4058